MILEKKMTDFVLEQDKLMIHRLNDPITFTMKVTDYALFLNQPPKKGMFIPCDEDDNVLEKSKENEYLSSLNPFDREIYKKAKENVIFEGFQVIEDNNNYCQIFKENNDIVFYKSGTIYFNGNKTKTIEDLIPYKLKINKQF